MPQHVNVEKPQKRYTRGDFTALRFKLNRLPIEQIQNRLYSEDDLDERGIHTPHQLEVWLDELRDQLVEVARYTNPHTARNLEDARKFNTWPKGVIDFIIAVGEKNFGRPALSDSIGQWFKPIVSKSFRSEGLETVGKLKSWIELRGTGWYRPLPRLGAGKASVIESWYRRYSADLGDLHIPSNDPDTSCEQLGPGSHLLPLERISTLAPSYDGLVGKNRATQFCLISARTDLEAIQAYLYRYQGRSKTQRAYQKELERFLLWCVRVARVPLSSVLTDECEQYKLFLKEPASDWTGPKAPRASERWRPFEGPLSPSSQKYAVQALRSFFEWSVRVRYLGGNPWITVADPLVEAKENLIDVDKAFCTELWEKLSAKEGLFHELERLSLKDQARKQGNIRQAQLRVARAAILLLGYGGLRREEAAAATRQHLKRVPDYPDLWELKVLGKRKKWRTVFLPGTAVDAISVHWKDRGLDFSIEDPDIHLLSPVVIPNTSEAQDKHTQRDGALKAGSGYSPDGLYTVIKSALTRIADESALSLTDQERKELRAGAPHAFRHTFATQAAAKNVDIDVLQRLLGHASMQTTTIYTNAEKKRSQEQAARFFAS